MRLRSSRFHAFSWFRNDGCHNLKSKLAKNRDACGCDRDLEELAARDDAYHITEILCWAGIFTEAGCAFVMES